MPEGIMDIMGRYQNYLQELNRLRVKIANGAPFVGKNERRRYRLRDIETRLLPRLGEFIHQGSWNRGLWDAYD